MSDLKHKGISQKSQGDQAKPKSASDARQQHMPRTLNRGAGSEFADAVRSIMEDAKSLRGSQTDFLGVPKKTLDPKDYSHSFKKGKK